MEIKLAGTQEEQNPGKTVIDFPEGYGQWAFMLFHTPFMVKTDDGVIRGEPGNILINTPDYPMWHGGIDGVFKNDWFHSLGGAMESRLRELEIPVNTPLELPLSQTLSRYFRFIRNEWFLKPRYWEESCRSWVNLLLLEIHRRLKESGVDSTQQESLREVRQMMRENPAHPWSIEDLARLVHLSPSRFSHLFKEYFTLSPWEDLLQCRLDLARVMLIQTDLKNREIAFRCGFSDERYFSRFFRSREGTSPGAFRRRSEKKEPSAEGSLKNILNRQP